MAAFLTFNQTVKVRLFHGPPRTVLCDGCEERGSTRPLRFAAPSSWEISLCIPWDFWTVNGDESLTLSRGTKNWPSCQMRSAGLYKRSLAPWGYNVVRGNRGDFGQSTGAGYSSATTCSRSNGAVSLRQLVGVI